MIFTGNAWLDSGVGILPGLNTALPWLFTTGVCSASPSVSVSPATLDGGCSSNNMDSSLSAAMRRVKLSLFFGLTLPLDILCPVRMGEG